MGRIEIDFFPKVDPMKQLIIGLWNKKDRNKLKLSEGVEIDKDAEISLGLEWFVDNIKISLFCNDLILVT